MFLEDTFHVSLDTTTGSFLNDPLQQHQNPKNPESEKQLKKSSGIGNFYFEFLLQNSLSMYALL